MIIADIKKTFKYLAGKSGLPYNIKYNIISDIAYNYQGWTDVSVVYHDENKLFSNLNFLVNIMYPHKGSMDIVFIILIHELGHCLDCLWNSSTVKHLKLMTKNVKSTEVMAWSYGIEILSLLNCSPNFIDKYKEYQALNKLVIPTTTLYPYHEYKEKG